MTVVNPKSISGINSITTGSGSDDILTIHTNNGTERLRVDSTGATKIVTGIVTTLTATTGIVTTLTTNTLTANSTTKVGSGVTLSPDGDVFATGITTISKTGGNGQLIVERAGGAGLHVQAQSALGVFGTTSNHNLRFISNSNERMLLSTNGNIGIGSDAPTHNLDIHASGNPYLKLLRSGYNPVYIGNAAGEGVIESTGATFFKTGGSERLRITGIGSVGINATNPNALLEVRGTAGTYTNAITVFSGNTTHSGSNAKNGIALHSFGDALSGGLSSNLLYSNSSSPTQSYATRSSGEITFDNTTSSSQTSVIKFGGYYKGTTSFVERLRITSGGNLLLGTDTETNNIRLGNKLGVVGTTAYTGMSITNYPGTNAQHSPLFDFNRSRGTSDGSLTSVVAGDKLGELIFRGSNGSDFTDAVALRAFAENVAGSHVNGKFEIQTYQGGAASVKVGVSSEGHVTKPSQPYFVARAGSSRNDVTNQVLVFDTAVRNNGNHYSTSTSKFTAPVEGAYIFGGSPAYMETDDTMSIVIRKNGSTVYEVERVVAGSMTQHSMFGFSTLLYLAADDEVDLYILGQCHQNGTYSHWFGYLLG